ncbi:hypothetical protein [Pseudobutyrivibrio sp. C4]|uniref:hypothetical protein n=1 Tax=Pseudobutyrivibrio sp. C4 TaxID=1520803 RepID=UPI0015A5CFB5|nr:hypothetical protein [Pseudobutyrivibrio sp. C4]
MSTTFSVCKDERYWKKNRYKVATRLIVLKEIIIVANCATTKKLQEACFLGAFLFAVIFIS